MHSDKTFEILDWNQQPQAIFKNFQQNRKESLQRNENQIHIRFAYLNYDC